MRNRKGLTICVFTLLSLLVTTRAAAQATAKKSQSSLPAGLGALYILPVGAWDFQPNDSTVATGTTNINGADFLRTATGSSPAVLVAPVHLPSGVIIDHIELDACDVDAVADVTVNITTCVDDSNGPGACTVRGTALTSGSPGCVQTPSASINYGLQNSIEDVFVTATLPLSQNIGLRAVKIYYRLYVSFPPFNPTFNDVPAGDPGFQFIEAFTAAQITAGCSAAPPLYCPDAPVTRRQVAVFFAKALGLYFPN